jgi:uncharacterized protein (DUF952 family)
VSLVYKIIGRQAWEEASARGRFDGASVDIRDGYIHLSTGSQVQETARLHFHGQPDLVVVAFEAERFGDALKWELSRGGQLFPHLYGVLDPALGLSVRAIPLDEGGVPRPGPLP